LLSDNSRPVPHDDTHALPAALSFIPPHVAWLAFALLMLMFCGVIMPAIWHPRAANRRAAEAVLDRVIRGIIDIIRALRSRP
jgi:hypothetical protein